MDAQGYWQVFLETGAPEMYLLYSKAKRLEDVHVLDDSRFGTARDDLQ